MKTFFLNHKSQCLLLLIAVVWMVFVAFVFRLDLQTLAFGDSRSYVLAAVDLYEKGLPNDHRPLVISAINGFPLLFGFSHHSLYAWSLLVNLSCWLGTVLLVYSMAKRLVSVKLAFLAAVLFICSAGNLFIAFHLLSETVFAFWLLLILYCVQKQVETDSIPYLAFAVSLAVLAIMIKPLALLLVVLLMVFFYRKWIQLFKDKYSVFVYLSGLLLFFQLYSMQKTYGNFTVSYIDSFTYYNYLGTRADCLKNNAEFIQGKNARYVYFSMLTPAQQKTTAAEDLSDQLGNNAANLAKAYFINAWNNSSKGSASVYGCQNKAGTSYFGFFHLLFKTMAKAQNILFTAIALLLSFGALMRWKRHPVLIIICALVVLYVIALSAISSDQGDRFHIVLYPVIILVMAYVYQKRYIHD